MTNSWRTGAGTVKREERTMNQKAQGDVLLTRVDELPEGLKKLKTKTVAEGELTGHHHTFQGSAVLYADEQDVWVVVKERGATLVHQEHTDIDFEVGVWKYDAQVELDPLVGIRRVKD